MEQERNNMKPWTKIGLKAGLMVFIVSLPVNLTVTETVISRQAERTIKPPPVEAQATTAREEIVTGVCDFGACPVATTACITACTTAYDLETVEEVVVAKNATTEESSSVVEESLLTAYDYSATYTAHEFCQLGEIYWGGWRWTWYSEQVLPGGGLDIPGRHTEGGYVMDGNGYICLASDTLDYGTVIETPFGSYGRVYDCGCDYDTIDVYVSW